MPFTNRKTYRTRTIVSILGFLLLLVLLYYYFCFVNVSWLPKRLDISGPEQTTGYLARSRWLLGAALFVLSALLLNKLPKRLQIIITMVGLLTLLGLFMATFKLSFSFIALKIGYLITQGAFTTLYVSAASIAIAFCIALITAVARLSQNGVATGIATFYVSLFRGLPLLLQIFIMYMGLPQLGFVINPIPCGIAALSLCYGAYMSEVFRAGILSIPKGQWEASHALGLHKRKIMRLIILPQALRIIIPPTGNHFIAMLKDSSLVSVVGVWELTYLSSTLGNRDFRNMEMLISAAAIYWVMSITLEFIQSRIEGRFQTSPKY